MHRVGRRVGRTIFRVLDRPAAQIPANLMHLVRMSRHDGPLHFYRRSLRDGASALTVVIRFCRSLYL